MKPTMKLRLLRSRGMTKGEPFMTDSYGSYYRLQQWWTKDDVIPGYEHLVGEWQDIPIEVEE